MIYDNEVLLLRILALVACEVTAEQLCKWLLISLEHVYIISLSERYMVNDQNFKP